MGGWTVNDEESPYAEDIGTSGYKPWRGRAELKAMQPEFRDYELERKLHLWTCLGTVLIGLGFIVWIVWEVLRMP